MSTESPFQNPDLLTGEVKRCETRVASQIGPKTIQMESGGQIFVVESTNAFDQPEGGRGTDEDDENDDAPGA